MKAGKILKYAAVIGSLFLLSISAPLAISAVSEYVVSRVSGMDGEESGKEEAGSDKESTGGERECTGSKKEGTGGGQEGTGSEKEGTGGGQECTGSEKDGTGGEQDEAERGNEGTETGFGKLSSGMEEDSGNEQERTSAAIEKGWQENRSESEKQPADKGSSSGRSGQVQKETLTLADDKNFEDVPVYDEPVFKNPEEEAAADREAWESLAPALKSLEEAAAAYRSSFHPEYEELQPGLMESFLPENAGEFYTALAEYCFTRYNSARSVTRVRLDAILEDTDVRRTAIFEIFTDADETGAVYRPRLAVCTCSRKTGAYVFFRGDGS